MPGNLTLFQTKETQFCCPVPDKMVKIDTLFQNVGHTGALAKGADLSIKPDAFWGVQMPITVVERLCFLIFLSHFAEHSARQSNWMEDLVNR